MTLTDLYAFSFKAKTSYDADTQIMKVKFSGEQYGIQPITQWSESTVEGGSYIGSNNFGVKRRISIFHTTHYNIQTDQPSWLLAEITHQAFSENGLALTEDGPTARLLSNTLGVLLIGSLTPPYATAETGVNTPTIDNPVDNTTVDRTLHVKLSAVWLYNLGTGEVIKRYGKAASEHDLTIDIPAIQTSKSVYPIGAHPTTFPAVNISSGVAAGMLLEKTQPFYPPIAKAARVSGTVVLQVTISETGLIESPRVVSGPAMLQQAALDAVKNWRYRPYLLNNEPVKVETTVNVIFALGG
jgi:TonB family protein